MPVVINDFEVVTEQDASRSTPTPSAAEQPRAVDVERLLAEQRARVRRVRAY